MIGCCSNAHNSHLSLSESRLSTEVPARPRLATHGYGFSAVVLRFSEEPARGPRSDFSNECHDTHELGERVDFHLLHHAGAMDFHRSLAQTEPRGDDLVQFSSDNELEDLALASREPLEPRHCPLPLTKLVTAFFIELKGLLDSIQKILVAKR